MSFHLGSAKAWRIVLGVLALVCFVAAIPLTMLSDQLGDAVVAAVIGIPCAAVGSVVARLQDELDPETACAGLTGVVHAALAPAHVSVWLRQ